MQTGAPAAHEKWSSRMVFLLASIGAAVGLGNIWKFPYTLGQNGGSAFVVVYLAAVFLVATPIMMSEMVMGRLGRMSPPNSLRKLARDAGKTQAWVGLGWLGNLGAFVILSFYSVIAGWSIAYITKTATGTFTGLLPAQTAQVFGDFLAAPYAMIGWHFTFMVMTIYIVSRGIRAGIERWINFLMPGLFILLIGLVIYAVIEGDIARTMDYLFSPDFSKITPQVALAAVGQAFFSVNVGLGMVLVYSAYLPAEVSLPRSALIIATGDTIIALLAGLAIFPIVFAHGLDPAEGPGLLFVTLSTAFGSMPGGVIVGTVFFSMVLVAALTSGIGILEVLTARAEETEGLSRARAAPMIGAAIFFVGLATVFSFNILANFKPLDFIPTFAGKTIFDLLDYLVSNIILPLGGLLYAIFAGWILSREATVRELGLGDGFAYKLWLYLTRFVAPLAVAAVFVFNLV